MTWRIPKNASTWLLDWSSITIMSNTLPPRDPSDDDDDDVAEDEDGEDDNQSDEPAVVREPDDE